MPILTTASTEYQRLAIAQAQFYGLQGWKVVVLHGIAERNGSPICTCPKGADCPDPGKHPRLSGWPSLATSNENAIGIRRIKRTREKNMIFFRLNRIS